ncbi:amino acid ABC transporter ATP-binding protein [Paracoccus sp. (in: a-proteobacteria)]|uniref:amino acid ABC transporter ATP-binding protein n=1 Tax=Paracoccus sp. TaxID=267 RepID=UPI0028972D3F|nr:amino acid ABC transporter ATP-binding protein [Paracoccus sp. (in: a-proteobacteria)]
MLWTKTGRAKALLLENQKTLVRVDSLGKSFGSLEVLQNISLEVKSGEVLAIIGPSGSGKSTLLRCLNFLETPDIGNIEVAGVKIDAGKHPSQRQILELRRMAGMVFQSFNLFPHMTVLENVSFAQKRIAKRSQAEADARSIELLKRVGLEQKAREYPHRCSGGQQQRIAIARALALSPKVMLFDEPTSALDPELGLEVLSVMRELAQDGMTMIVVTHEMQFAESVSDHVMIMADGKAIEYGPSAEIMRNPQTARAQRFLHAVRDR